MATLFKLFEITRQEMSALLGLKADKVASATAGNVAVLNSSGNIADGGKSVSELEGGKVRYDEAQTLTDVQKGQARANIGASGIVGEVAMTDLTAELSPNVFYSWGEVASLAITLSSAIAGELSIYAFKFVSGATAATVTWPSGITWSGGTAPTIKANKSYEVSIHNGLALINEF